jgi:type IV secretory pathway VirD2 relaxase
MILGDDDRAIRIRPRKPRAPQREAVAWTSGFRLLMHYARGVGKGNRRRALSRGPGASRSRNQRCAVRVTYLNNRTRGQWKAHGRYLARESARDDRDGAAAFNRDGEAVDVVRELDQWQSSGDARIWKIILSPEFGERIDLRQLTRDLAERMAADLGANLEWVAEPHYNTEHPHVHMVIRGMKSDGQPLHFDRDYIRHGIREIAEDLCTRQLGYRTGLDAAHAEHREISEARFTSLYRLILRDAADATHDAQYFTVATNRAGLSESTRLNRIARLGVLQRMGLAKSAGLDTLHVRRDIEEVLRAMQRTRDRQKTLAAHGVPVSDGRLPIVVLDTRQFRMAEGRVLVHGQDEDSGRNYLMLEGTDTKVHFIHYTPEMEAARRNGEMRTNSYIRLRRINTESRPVIDVRDFGDAEALLKNPSLLREKARALLKEAIVPAQDGWGGWLGRYQAALANTAAELSQEWSLARPRERNRDRSRGR